MEQGFAFAGEARSAVGHDSAALGGTDLTAEVGFAGLTEFAFAAFRGAVSWLVSDGMRDWGERPEVMRSRESGKRLIGTMVCSDAFDSVRVYVL